MTTPCNYIVPNRSLAVLFITTEYLINLTLPRFYISLEQSRLPMVLLDHNGNRRSPAAVLTVAATSPEISGIPSSRSVVSRQKTGK